MHNILGPPESAQMERYGTTQGQLWRRVVNEDILSGWNFQWYFWLSTLLKVEKNK
jgi:hypothetical protein